MAFSHGKGPIIPVFAELAVGVPSTRMDLDIEDLRQIEAECIARFQQKARALRDADPALSAQIARAKAASLLPQTMEKYLSACSRLQFAGIFPRTWK